MTIITRFAPSPTGRLHMGNVRTALINWLWARQQGGRFLLRLDDTDHERSTAAFADSIRHDLAWLGMAPDAEVRQSDRGALYETEFARLRDAGRVYPAYETPEELELRRKVLAGRGLPPVYERTALSLTEADRTQLEAEGRRPHWRFKLDHAAPLVWDDLIRGPQRFDPAKISDPIIRRADGSWLYMLPSVIDDIAMGISHVVRGEDHVTNTALQIQMFQALGSRPPAFAHAALLTGSDAKLSKRLGAMTLDEPRDQGIEPLAIQALLARIGTSQPVEPVTDPGPLIERFAFSQMGRAPARFDYAELEQLNQRIIHHLPYSAVASRLPVTIDAAGWEAIRPNLASVAEASTWWTVVTGELATPHLSADDCGYLLTASTLVATLDWQANPWQQLTTALKASSGRTGKALFLPLRQALTGQEHGPDMAALLPLIGQARALARLQAAAATGGASVSNNQS
jgi:glutamyl-tRNA synthetase